MLEAAERARVLLRQGGADLLHLAAELAQSRLHVGQHVAVAPIGVPYLTGNALQRILQAGGGMLGLGLVGGRHGLFRCGQRVRVAVHAAWPAVPKGAIEAEREAGFARAGGGVGARGRGHQKAVPRVAIRRKVSVKSASAVDCA